MKFILLVLCFVCSLSFGQSKKIIKETGTSKILDTLNYLKNDFEAKKSQYIGKPFSFLLSKMVKIQPKTVWNAPGVIDHSVVEKSIFRFYDINYPILNETKMLITWQTEFSYKTVDTYSRRNKYYFTNAERRLYGNKIIKDILVYR